MSYIVLSVHRFHQFCEYVRLFFLFSSHLFFRTLKSKLHLSLPLKRKPFKIISKKILLHAYKFISSYSFYSQSQKNELFFFIIESWIILYWILNYLYFFITIILVHGGKTGNDPDPAMKSIINLETWKQSFILRDSWRLDINSYR